MNSYKKSLKGFHSYSIRNLILANYQHYARTGETIDLLASYKKWQEKGEKAIHVIAPRHKTITEVDITGEPVEKTITYFVRVPVFDISQTEGEELEQDYTINNTNLTFKEISDKITDIPILSSEKHLTEKGRSSRRKERPSLSAEALARYGRQELSRCRTRSFRVPYPLRRPEGYGRPCGR